MTVLLGNSNTATSTEHVLAGEPTGIWRRNALEYSIPAANGSATHASVNVSSGANGSRSIRVALYDQAGNLLSSGQGTPANGFAGVFSVALSPVVSVTEQNLYSVAYQISNGGLRLTRASSSGTWARVDPTPAFADPFPDPFVNANTNASGQVNVWIIEETGGSIISADPDGITDVGTTTATGNIVSDTASGTIYGVVNFNSVAPSGATIEAGTGAESTATVTSPIVGTNSLNFTGLTAGAEEMYIHAVQKVGSLYSNTVTLGPFDTIDPPEVSMISTYRPGEPVTLTVRGIDAAYTITAAGASATVTGDSLDLDGNGTITFTAIRGNYRYGANVPIVLTMGATVLNEEAPLEPEPGKAWVNLVAPLATSGERLTAIPDLAGTDQVAWYSVTGGTIADVDVLSDGSINGAAAVTGFMVEAHNGTEWGEPALQGVTNLSNPPQTRRSVTIRAAVNPPGVPVGVNATGVLGTFSAGTAGAVGGEPGEGYTLADATAGLPFAVNTPIAPTITSENLSVTPANIGSNLSVNGRRMYLTAGTYGDLAINGQDQEIIIAPGCVVGNLSFWGSARRIIVRAEQARNCSVGGVNGPEGGPTFPEDILVDGISSNVGRNRNFLHGRRFAIINSFIRTVDFPLCAFNGEYYDVIVANCSLENYGGTLGGNEEAGVRFTSISRFVFVDNRVYKEGGTKHVFRFHGDSAPVDTENVYVCRNNFGVTAAHNIQPQGGDSATSNVFRHFWYENNWHSAAFTLNGGAILVPNTAGALLNFTVRNNTYRGPTPQLFWTAQGTTPPSEPTWVVSNNDLQSPYQDPPAWEFQ